MSGSLTLVLAAIVKEEGWWSRPFIPRMGNCDSRLQPLRLVSAPYPPRDPFTHYTLSTARLNREWLVHRGTHLLLSHDIVPPCDLHDRQLSLIGHQAPSVRAPYLQRPLRISCFLLQNIVRIARRWWIGARGGSSAGPRLAPLGRNKRLGRGWTIHAPSLSFITQSCLPW